jgi:tRNA dimethylallyltransferase
MKSVIAVVGPTAVGKTQLAILIAQSIGGEIINADSRQLYKLMDIGTAKPGREELQKVKHHMIDIIFPNEIFSLALYRKMAADCIDTISSRNKVPILTGGTGLYIWALLEGWTVPEVPPDNSFRNRMEQLARDEGGETLFKKLSETDPVAADKIAPTNIRRVIRALEIIEATGKPASHFWKKENDNYNICMIGLTASRDKLYQRIDNRVDDMIKRGLVGEVKSLIERGYGLDLSAMSGIGYRQIGMYLQGKLTLDEAVEKTKYVTHQFARRQYNWFRLTDSRIKWFNINDRKEDAVSFVRQYLKLGN